MGKSSLNTQKGKQAENLATAFLVHNGWTILARNVFFVGGEIDLIAKDPQGVLVFVEVKSCWTHGFGRPLAQVHRKKQVLLWKSALRWISTHQIADQSMRFDVIAIQWAQDHRHHIEYLANAFEGPSSTW